MKLKIRKLREDAITPTLGTNGSNKLYLHVVEALPIPESKENPGRVAKNWNHMLTFRTGIALEVPKGYVCMITIIPELSVIYGYKLASQVVMIDSSYKGEISLTLNVPRGIIFPNFAKGDVVAQMSIMPAKRVKIKVVE